MTAEAETGLFSLLATAGAPGRMIRPVLGVLPDGTPYYAPIGEIVSDGETVTCHLCGRALRSVSAHLRSHGWTKADYCEAFGLERGRALEGMETRNCGPPRSPRGWSSTRPSGRAARRAGGGPRPAS